MCWCAVKKLLTHSVGSLLHARSAATDIEKALSLIRRRARGTTKSPDDEARNVDRPRISATVVSMSVMWSGVWPSDHLWTIKYNLYWILSTTGDSWRAGAVWHSLSRKRQFSRKDRTLCTLLLCRILINSTNHCSCLTLNWYRHLQNI